MQDKASTLAHYRAMADQAALAADAPGLHPVFGEIVGRFMSMTTAGDTPPLDVHYPEVGRRRPYRSMGDAMAYEAGWLAFSLDSVAPTERTPFYDGWWDAFSAQESRDTYANERHLDDDGDCLEPA